VNSRSLFYQVHGRKPARAARRVRSGRGPVRSSKYRAWIRTQASVVSGLLGCEAAHTGSDGGMRQKASDLSCLPLTPAEHLEYHRIGKPDFEARHGIDCADLVREFNAVWAFPLL
jgi:hypothetical protein